MNEKLRLTSRGCYAMMAMVHLANHAQEEPVPLSDIARKAEISLSYLEQLVAGLRRHKLVKSARGPGGGYVLAKIPSAISIPEILLAAEDSIPAKKSGANENFRIDNCPHTAAFCDDISAILFDGLKGKTLADIIKRCPAKIQAATKS